MTTRWQHCSAKEAARHLRSWDFRIQREGSRAFPLPLASEGLFNDGEMAVGVVIIPGIPRHNCLSHRLLHVTQQVPWGCPVDLVVLFTGENEAHRGAHWGPKILQWRRRASSRTAAFLPEPETVLGRRKWGKGLYTCPGLWSSR